MADTVKDLSIETIEPSQVYTVDVDLSAMAPHCCANDNIDCQVKKKHEHAWLSGYIWRCHGAVLVLYIILTDQPLFTSALPGFGILL